MKVQTSNFLLPGNEYQAVFLSTTEPVDSNGNTTNPTKSPCDPYVFNTILTRSKSLVVVVGSPMTLLGIEEHMVKHYGGKARCWSSYLNLCLEKNTFIIPSEVEPNEKVKKSFKSALRTKLSNGTVSDTSKKETSSQPATVKRYSDVTRLSTSSEMAEEHVILSSGATRRRSNAAIAGKKNQAQIGTIKVSPPPTNGPLPVVQQKLPLSPVLLDQPSKKITSGNQTSSHTALPVEATGSSLGYKRQVAPFKRRSPGELSQRCN